MHDLWQHPLGKHLLVVLLIKLMAIGLIWWMFFRPVTPVLPVTAVQVEMEMVGSHSSDSSAIIPSSHSSRESVK